MKRITTRIPEEHVDAIDQIVEEDGYPTRSEAIREALREFVADDHPHRFADQQTGTIAGMDTYHDRGES